jgi:hypothetical protein
LNVLHSGKTTARLAALGLCYGFVLAVFSLLTAGAGHGTYVTTGLFSAPLGLSGFVVAVCGTPVLWALVFYLVSKADRPGGLTAFLSIVGSHYLAAAFLLSGEPIGDWDSFWKWLNVATVAPIIISGLVVYIVGQAVMWAAFMRVRRGVKRRTPVSD